MSRAVQRARQRIRFVSSRTARFQQLLGLGYNSNFGRWKEEAVICRKGLDVSDRHLRDRGRTHLGRFHPLLRVDLL